MNGGSSPLLAGLPMPRPSSVSWGGVWWGQAVQNGRAGAGAYLVSVMPSLLAVALFLPWTIGWELARARALLYLGFAAFGSPPLAPLIEPRAGLLRGADFLRFALGILSLGLGAA